MPYSPKKSCSSSLALSVSQTSGQPTTESLSYVGSPGAKDALLRYYPFRSPGVLKFNEAQPKDMTLLDFSLQAAAASSSSTMGASATGGGTRPPSRSPYPETLPPRVIFW